MLAQLLIIIRIVSSGSIFQPNEDGSYPLDPIPCDLNNQGGCDCSDEVGFQTYTYFESEPGDGESISDQRGKQRCFTIYTPSDIVEHAPVVLHMSCYSSDQLKWMGFYSGPALPKGDGNGNKEVKNADRWGFILVGLSVNKGRKDWAFPNPKALQEGRNACDDTESRDLRYAKKVYSFLESDSMRGSVDLSRIYTEGFSQNGNFAGYIGYCLRDKTAMVIQGGSGLHMLSSDGVLIPDGESAKSWLANPRQAYSNFPADTTTYPYVISASATTHHSCAIVGKNDRWKDSTYNLNHFMIKAGLDVRFFEFKGLAHAWPRDYDAWWMGCTAMNEKCTDTCVESFEDCIQVEQQFEKNRLVAFQTCITFESMDALEGCAARCSPTLEMLSLMPSWAFPEITLNHGQFGSENFAPTMFPTIDPTFEPMSESWSLISESAKQRCGPAARVTGWNNYGFPNTIELCAEACIADPECLYASSNMQNNGCTGYNSCILRNTHSSFTNVQIHRKTDLASEKSQLERENAKLMNAIEVTLSEPAEEMVGATELMEASLAWEAVRVEKYVVVQGLAVIGLVAPLYFAYRKCFRKDDSYAAVVAHEQEI